ncbi:MAG: cytochrome c3 family protein [Desulfuromonas sp.]|nr:cytochrome c3 family protein [Desulfuromonas sp.]
MNTRVIAKLCSTAFLLLWGISVSGVVLAATGDYTASAHGQNVKRTGMPDAYAVGNCAHCHEQHGTIGSDEPDPGFTTPFSFLAFSDSPVPVSGATYSQDDNFCFYCHSSTVTSVQSGGISNLDYAATFGGYVNDSPEGILEAFNSSGSIHNLDYIYEYVAGNGTYSRPADFSYFTAKSNPCTACHNPHLAKANRSDVEDQTLSVLSLPSDHNDLYGDNLGERMADFAGAKYQAPYYYASTTTYEPGNNGISDGSTLPDYNTFCLECHQNRVPTSDHLNHVDGSYISYIESINWTDTSGDGGLGDIAGDKHGMNDNTTAVVTRSPFGSTGGYVLSCLDCHEPHGSSNSYLIRRSINGEALSGTIGSGDHDRGNQCRQCHKDDYEMAGSSTPALINSWKTTHHGGGATNPYKASQLSSCGCHDSSRQSDDNFPIPCERCHYHGSYVPNPYSPYAGPKVTPKQAPYFRKTF